MKVTNSNFEEIVEKSKSVPVLLDFWAAWCGPCRMLSPILEELESELVDKAVIGKINVDQENELSTRFQVSSIPTLLLVKDGQIAGKIVGYQNKDQLKKFIGIE